MGHIRYFPLFKHDLLKLAFRTFHFHGMPAFFHGYFQVHPLRGTGHLGAEYDFFNGFLDRFIGFNIQPPGEPLSPVIIAYLALPSFRKIRYCITLNSFSKT